MAIISNIDWPNRRIYLHLDTVNASVNPFDIYKEMRTLRKDDENLRKFDLFMSGHWRDSKGGWKFTERYFKLLDWTRVVPYDTTHELTITGTIITDDWQEWIACFDRTTLTTTSVVDINYVPPQVEIIELNWWGWLTTEEHDAIINTNTLTEKIIKYVKLIFIK